MNKTTFNLLGLVVMVTMLTGCTEQTKQPTPAGNPQPVTNGPTVHPVDPALLDLDSGYREMAEYPTELKSVYAIAVGPDDKIYVAGEKAVWIGGPDGKKIASHPINEIPTAIAVGAGNANRVYLAFKDHMGHMDATTGEVVYWPSLGTKAWLTGLAINEDSIFAADAGNYLVLRLDENGDVQETIGNPNPERGVNGFVIPSPYFDVAIDSNDLLVVTNPGSAKIEQFDLDGAHLGQWGHGTANSKDVSGFYGCCNPSHIAVLPGGDIITSEKGLPRVKIFTEKGKYKGMIADTDQLARIQPPRTVGEPGKVGIFDVATDRSGHVLLLDPNSKSVRVFGRQEAVAP